MATTRQEVLEAISKAQTLFVEYTEGMQAELAEGEKPKLRHGDYGFDGSRSPGRIALTLNNRLVSAGNSSVFDTTFEDRPDLMISPVLSNIFDDLKALSEDLTGTETVSPADLTTTYWIDHAGDLLIDIKTNEKQTVVKAEDIPALILDLRRMEATLKRKKNAKGDA